MDISDKQGISHDWRDQEHKNTDMNHITLSKSELKKLEKQEKKEEKRRIKEEKKRSKLLQHSEISEYFSQQAQLEQLKEQDEIKEKVNEKNVSFQDDQKNDNNVVKNEKLGNRWVVNSQTSFSFDEDGDWEDELKEELENKWKEIDSNEGPIMLTSIKQTIKKFWTRSLEKLPLHSDLPRLVHGLEIVDETTGTMVYIFIFHIFFIYFSFINCFKN